MNLRLKILLLTLFVLLINALLCSGQTDFTASTAQQYLLKTLNTSITGKITNPTEKLVHISYHKNSFNFNPESLVLPVDEDGNFKIDFDLIESAALKLSYQGKSISLFLQKGDDLKIAFEGADMFNSIHFQGRGAKNNEYLMASKRKFDQYDQGYLLYAISQKSADDYKQLIDKINEEKFAFYEAYSNADKAKMTPEFKDYIRTDYTYWRANQLLNYRIEHPILTGKPAPLDLPAEYYSFLKDLNFMNEVVSSNRNYCEFLEEYLKYEGEKEAKEKALDYASKVVTEPNMLINERGDFVHINAGDRIQILNQSESELNKEAIEKILPAFDANALDYIKMADGTKGWVRNLSAGTLVEEKDDPESRIMKYAICKKHNAKLIKDPGTNTEVITALGYGEEVNYMHLKTSERFVYSHHGVEYYGRLAEVETKRGQKGWILETFIDVLEKKVFEKEKPGQYLYSLTGTSEARQFLKGEALYYSLAKALYWKIKLNQSSDIAREIAAFASHNEYKVFNDILRAEYDVEQLRKKRSDSYIETYAYSNLKSPVIANVKVGLPFDKSAFVSETKAQVDKTYLEISNVVADRPSSLVNLSGKIEAGYLKKASLTIIFDYITYQEEEIPLNVDQEGKYKINKELKDPVLAVLKCGNKSLDLYLYPGDNIVVDFNANNFPNSVKFEGKSSALNTYLFKERGVFETQLNAIARNSENMNPKDFADFAKELYKKRIQYYGKYKKKNPVNSQDQLFINSNIRYQYATMLFNYEDMQCYLQQKESINLPRDFYSPIADFPNSVEGLLPNLHYVEYIHEFLNHHAKQSSNRNLTKIEVAEQFFSGEVLAYIKAKELAKMCQLGKAYEYGPAIQKYLDQNNYKQYNDVLRVVYNENKPIQNGDMAPDFKLKDIAGNEVKLSSLRGKVVYIDFWATWCRPCIKSMTYSQRLLEKYKDDDVVFLYVSLDEKPALWKSFVASQNLSGVHINTNTSTEYLSDISKLYKVKQLPTFVIVDKNGKIAFNKAGSPGNKVVSNLIDGLLESPRF